MRSRAASAGLVLALALSGCGDDDGGGTVAERTDTELVVDLAELNGSGQTGTATLTPSGEGTMVTVETVSYLVDPQPTGIHRGTCAKPGARVHELATIEDGISVTTLDVPLADLRSGLVVVVAESRRQPDVRVACGAID